MMAGKVETVRRRSHAIKVPSRSRTCQMRNQLVKSMSNLSFAPAKLNSFSKGCKGRKNGVDGGAQHSLRSVAPGHHEASVGYKGNETQRVGKAKCRAKGRTRPKKTQKNRLVGGNSLKSCLASCMNSFRGIGNKQGAGLHQESRTLAVTPRLMTPIARLGRRGVSVELLTILTPSMTPQPSEPLACSSREKKRSFAHAMLEGASKEDETAAELGLVMLVLSMMTTPATIVSNNFCILRECLVPHGALRFCRAVSFGVTDALPNDAVRELHDLHICMRCERQPRLIPPPWGVGTHGRPCMNLEKYT